jgi:hypothetical protein
MLLKETSMFIVRIIRNSQIQNAKLLMIKAGGAYSYYWALKGGFELLECMFLNLLKIWRSPGE